MTKHALCEWIPFTKTYYFKLTLHWLTTPLYYLSAQYVFSHLLLLLPVVFFFTKEGCLTFTLGTLSFTISGFYSSIFSFRGRFAELSQIRVLLHSCCATCHIDLLSSPLKYITQLGFLIMSFPFPIISCKTKLL